MHYLKDKKYAEEKGFKLKNSKVGMVFIPIDDNKEDEEAEDDDYTDEEFYKVKEN